jgi:short-subunit dehydrogenase
VATAGCRGGSLANDSAGKAYVQTLGECLHVELKPLGVAVSVLIVGPTQTAIIDKVRPGSQHYRDLIGQQRVKRLELLVNQSYLCSLKH